MSDDCELEWAEANTVHGFPINKPKGYENAFSEKPSRPDARRRNQLPTDWPAPLAMRKRNKPLRRYIYRDPDTGQEFMCWRGEALDRITSNWSLAALRYWGSHEAALSSFAKMIRGRWSRDVRLRAPLANP